MAVKVLVLENDPAVMFEGVEDYGMHHWGEVITDRGLCNACDVWCRINIHYIDSRVKEDLNFKDESGYDVSVIMLFFGYATVLCCLSAQFCEFVSRRFRYNPKTNVTNQDTFIQRASSINHQSNLSEDEVEIDECRINTIANHISRVTFRKVASNLI